MTFTQIIRFLENRDSSSITHKTFNQSPQDKYPTFSICIKGKDIYWNHEDVLFQHLGVTSEQYVDMLKGDGWRYKFDFSHLLYKRKSFNFNNVSDNTLRGGKDLVPLNPFEIITGVHLIAQNVNDTTYYGSGKKGTRLQKHPFHIGIRTPDAICFTRNSEDTPGLIRGYDKLSLNNLLLKPGNNLFLEFRIIFHYPGQLLRNFDNPSFSSTLASYDKDRILQLTVSQVIKLINRPDSNIRCYDDGVITDDIRLKDELIKHIDCIPIYWKNLLSKTRQKKLCKSPEQMRIAYSQLKLYKEYFSTYDRPCVDMKTLVRYSKELPQLNHEFVINIVYKDNVFQEIRNDKEFTFESFFSSLGGFLGIFLGYSMLQIPDLIHNFSAFLKRSRYPKMMSKYLLFTNRVV